MRAGTLDRLALKVCMGLPPLSLVTVTLVVLMDESRRWIGGVAISCGTYRHIDPRAQGIANLIVHIQLIGQGVAIIAQAF